MKANWVDEACTTSRKNRAEVHNDQGQSVSAYDINTMSEFDQALVKMDKSPAWLKQKRCPRVKFQHKPALLRPSFMDTPGPGAYAPRSLFGEQEGPAVGWSARRNSKAQRLGTASTAGKTAMASTGSAKASKPNRDRIGTK
jgi:hypothetical protein